MHRELVVQLGIDHVPKMVCIATISSDSRSSVTICWLLCRVSLIDRSTARIGREGLGRCRWVRQGCQRRLEGLLSR